MPDKLSYFDEKIQYFKKKREKLQTQQALAFIKEIQKIFNKTTGPDARVSFSPEIALVIITNCWSTASDKQKKEWQVQATNFRSSSDLSPQKAHAPKPKPDEN